MSQQKHFSLSRNILLFSDNCLHFLQETIFKEKGNQTVFLTLSCESFEEHSDSCQI